jgi:hypothetical protein
VRSGGGGEKWDVVEVVEAGWSDWAAANTCTRPKGVIQR